MQEQEKDTGTLRNRIFNILGIVICVLLVPVLIINCTLLVKGWTNQDKVPDFFGISPLIVLSGSMQKEIPEGSLIMVQAATAAEIEEGDIIAYFDPASKTGAVVTHKVRFVKTNDAGSLVFYTYGTTNVKKPFEEVTESDCDAIPEKNLVGRYTGLCLPGVGRVAMFMQTLPGLIVCVIVPLIALVGYDIIRRRIYDKQHEDDKDELLRELAELRALRAAQDGAATKDETDE